MWLKDFPKFDLVVYVLLIVMYEGIGSSANPDDNFLIIPCWYGRKDFSKFDFG